jgi:glycosyltransferase involved in cell wall biosynthesis
MKRLAVVVSHPIQYYAPLYRALAQEPSLELHVLFASRIGLRKTLDPRMGVEVAWATDLSGGYSHEFLPEADSIQRTGFREVNNPSVGAALARFAPDAVLLHGYAMLTMLRALLWCRLHRVKTIMASDSSVHVSSRGPRRWAKRLLIPTLIRRFDAALTMGDKSEAHLARLLYPRDRMFRMPMMLDAGFWRARENRADIRARQRARLELREGEFTLLCSGKLFAPKRVLDILKALSLPPARGVTLLIAGDGELRSELEVFAAEHELSTRFLGFVNIDLLPEIYAAADALVHAAEHEQFGMVALEAAVVGLPLILSDETGAVGPTSIARPDVNALVFPRGDVDALARAIGRLRDDADLRARMGGASEAISRAHEGPESVAAVLRALAR